MTIRLSLWPVAVVGLAVSSCLTPRPTELVPAEQALAGALDPGKDGNVVRPGVEREVRALALTHPNHVPTLLADAALARESGDRERARGSLERALSLDPDHVDALLLMARLSSESGNLSVAEKRLRHAIHVRPDESRLREALAGVLYLRTEYEDALGELDATDALADAAARQLATVQAEQRARAQGTELTEEQRAELAEVRAPHWRTNYHRGLIAEALGDLTAALNWYEESEAENPRFEPAARRLRWLRAGLGQGAAVTHPTGE